MKKVIKNYLTKLQENDKKGFSLVELIIVMAIMAILVGIVASQVLPYMDKSRQSKDQQVLSSILTDVVSSVAQSGQTLTAVPNADICDLTSSNADAGWKIVGKTFEELRNGAVTQAQLDKQLGSKEAKAKNYSVHYSYDDKTGKVTVFIDGHSDDDVSSSKYIVESQNN